MLPCHYIWRERNFTGYICSQGYINTVFLYLCSFLTTPEFYNPLALNLARSSLKTSREDDELKGQGHKTRKVTELIEEASQTDNNTTQTAEEGSQTSDEGSDLEYSHQGSQTTEQGKNI